MAKYVDVDKLQFFPYSIQQLFQIKFALISSLEKSIKVNTVKHPKAPPQLFHLPPQHFCSSLCLQVPANEASMKSLHEVILV